MEWRVLATHQQGVVLEADTMVVVYRCVDRQAEVAGIQESTLHIPGLTYL